MIISTAITVMLATGPATADRPGEPAGSPARGVSLSGELTSFSPTWDRRKDTGAIASDMCDGVTMDSFNDGVAYQLFDLTTPTPNTALSVSVRSSEATPAEFDPFVSVYCQPFDPTMPEIGLIALDDDSGGYPDALISSGEGLLIQPGQTYYIVVSSYSTFGDSGLGRFEVSAGGDAVVSPACIGDTAPPFGEVDVTDVLAFLELFNAMNPAADVAPPFGVFDFDDVLAFVTVVGAGCP